MQRRVRLYSEPVEAWRNAARVAGGVLWAALGAIGLVYVATSARGLGAISAVAAGVLVMAGHTVTRALKSMRLLPLATVSVALSSVTVRTPLLRRAYSPYTFELADEDLRWEVKSFHVRAQEHYMLRLVQGHRVNRCFGSGPVSSASIAELASEIAMHGGTLVEESRTGAAATPTDSDLVVARRKPARSVVRAPDDHLVLVPLGRETESSPGERWLHPDDITDHFCVVDKRGASQIAIVVAFEAPQGEAEEEFRFGALTDMLAFIDSSGQAPVRVFLDPPITGFDVFREADDEHGLTLHVRDDI